jgi:hypothetical protein
MDQYPEPVTEPETVEVYHFKGVVYSFTNLVKKKEKVLYSSYICGIMSAKSVQVFYDDTFFVPGCKESIDTITETFAQT